jgi:arginyl-tRNA synthetase
MQDRERNVTFDWNKALSFEGNSGPYIQYAYVRAMKITKEAGLRHPE